MIGEAAVEGLIRTAKGRNAHGRLGTVFALGVIGDPRGLDLLIAALKDRNAEVRATAARHLPYGEPRTLAPYVDALDDRSAEVRQEAARALGGEWAPRAAVAPLARMALRDPDITAACTAIESLAAGRDPRGADALAAVVRDADRDSFARSCAARGLAAYHGSDVAFDALFAATSDFEESVAIGAIFAIGQLRDERATALLLRVLQSPPGDRRRVHAIDALGELGDRRAVEPLIQVLATEDGGAAWLARRRAARALAKIGDPRAVGVLTDALRDRDAGVREDAAQALAALTAARAQPTL